MQIRLIQPSQLDDCGEPIKYQKLFIPFLSLATIAGLTPEGVDVKITEDYVEEIDFDERIDLVGLTALTCQAPRAYQIADEFRKRGTKVIMGGIHVSMCPDEALEHVDSVVVGEAEDLWASVLDDLHQGCLRRRYEAKERPDLSRLVIPRFDLLDFGNYVVPPFAQTPLIPIQTTRGCPNPCDFCAVTRFLGRRMRTKPVSHVMREIEAANPSRVFFSDDNVVGDPRHAAELFTAMKPLKLRWSSQMSTQLMKHPDLIDLAAESGCHENFVGVETISEESLSSVHKGFNKVSEYAALFRRLKEVGILAQVSLVFGFDGDTVESLRRTVDTVMSWDVNYMYIFILTPLPGTRMYESLEKEGRILIRDWSRYDCMQPVMQYKHVSGEDVMAAMRASYNKFYSAKQIACRAFRFLPSYVRYCPRDSMVEELFMQLGMNRAVKCGQHPLTLGLRR